MIIQILLLLFNRTKVKIIKVDLNINVRSTDQQKLFYHVDVQTWVVTKDQKIYPFIGFYNFTNIQRNTMRQIMGNIYL